MTIWVSVRIHPYDQLHVLISNQCRVSVKRYLGYCNRSAILPFRALTTGQSASIPLRIWRKIRFKFKIADKTMNAYLSNSATRGSK